MGNKAKAAMTTASNAVKMMKTHCNDVIAAYQGMYNQKKITAQFAQDLSNYAIKKYPGQNDLSTYYATDAAVKGGFDNIQKSKAQTKQFRQSVLAGVVMLKKSMEDARSALAELDKLIASKAAKKTAAGKNPIKAIAAAAKTKSLPDLRKNKDEVVKALADTNAMAIAIIDYAEKKMRKEG